jgi:hypothetical protein
VKLAVVVAPQSHDQGVNFLLSLCHQRPQLNVAALGDRMDRRQAYKTIEP